MNTPLRRSTLSLCLILLGGCVLGPEYKRAPDAVAQRSTARQDFTATADPARLYDHTNSPDHWWRLYGDPVLDDLVAQALAHNTNLRVAAANIAGAEAQMASVSSAQMVNTSFDAAVMYAKLSQQEHMAVPIEGGYPNYWVGSMVMGLSYQVDFLGQIHRAVESAHENDLATRATYDMVRITVAANTARAYARACAAGHEITVIRHLIELQEQSAGLIKRLTQLGRGVSTDVTRATAQTSRTLAALPPKVAEQQVALFELAVLTGRPPAEFPRALKQCAHEPELHQPVPTGDGQALLQRRPDLRAAEARLHAATARIGQAQAEMWPHIVLGLSGGSTGLLGDMFTDKSDKFSIFPGVSWTFPNRIVARSKVSAAQAATDAAQAQFDGEVLAALREVETSLTVYGRDIETHLRMEKARDEAASARDDIERRFQNGRGTVLDVLEADRTLSSAELQVAELEGKLADDQMNVFLALGGGWTRDPGEDAAGLRPTPTSTTAQPAGQGTPLIQDVPQHHTGVRGMLDKVGDVTGF